MLLRTSQNDKRIKRSICKDVMNSVLYGTALKEGMDERLKDYGYYDEKNPEKGGMENFDVNDMSDLLKYLFTGTREYGKKPEFLHYQRYASGETKKSGHDERPLVVP